MTWKPHRAPLHPADGVTVQTLRSSAAHAAAHDVTLSHSTVRVYPTGATTTRGRYDTISRAATAAVEASRSTDVDLVAYFVGLCVLAGLTDLEIDGTPLFDTDSQLIGRIEADVYGDEIRLRVVRFDG